VSSKQKFNFRLLLVVILLSLITIPTLFHMGGCAKDFVKWYARSARIQAEEGKLNESSR
jgi:hypothetical protein